MNIEYVKNPRWSNSQKTTVDLVIKLKNDPEEYPFTASKTDTELHGRILFEAAARGEFGDIDEYVTPPVYTTTENTQKSLSISSLVFFERFTEPEQLAIVTATMTDPTIKLWYDKLLASKTVILTDPRLSSSLDNLVAKGIILAQRKAEILSEPETTGVVVL